MLEPDSSLEESCEEAENLDSDLLEGAKPPNNKDLNYNVISTEWPSCL